MARAENPVARVAVDPLQPFVPRLADAKPKARSVIFLFMVGGPSQVDTFDHKPLLQKLNGQPVPQTYHQSYKTKYPYI
jgi:hypothetical protein